MLIKCHNVLEMGCQVKSTLPGINKIIISWGVTMSSCNDDDKIKAEPVKTPPRQFFVYVVFP